MKPLNHMLLALVLLVTALPCFHAGAHGQQTHRPTAAIQIFGSHACCCHGSGQTYCPEEFEMPQQGFSAMPLAAVPPARAVLFIVPPVSTDFSLTATIISRVTDPICTVRLLI